MDKTDAINIAKKYASKIESNFNLKSIYLFGSFAKGNQNNDSDIDIAVILDDYDNLIKTQLNLMKLRRDIDSRIEPHPIREIDYNEFNPLANEIKKYGIKII